MNEKEKIEQLLYKYVYSGLVEKNTEQFLSCFSDQVKGIGLGEQGFVTSFQDVVDVFESGMKYEENISHTVELPRVEIIIPDENFAMVFAQVAVSLHRKNEEKVLKSQYQQTLGLIKSQGEWKVCGLHASAPVVTEESVEAFPIRFAEQTLCNLKEKIGEEAYRREEQYRRAVLADTIAFYIINFTKNIFEDCQVQNGLCVYTAPGTPYQEYMEQGLPDYVNVEDRENFLKCLSLDSIEQAFLNSSNEISCEYCMRVQDGSSVWARTTVRLIRDVITGEKKGIMYVKNIENDRQQVQEIKEKADRDGMTGVLNKSAIIREINRHLSSNRDISKSTFFMVDVDNFKNVNDSYGHPVGDEVLIAVAKILEAAFSSDAIVGRIGGDEFCIFLPGQQQSPQIKDHIESLLQKVREFSLPSIPGVKISVSAGGATRSGGTFESLYQTADTALYQAKKNGKNQAFYLDEPINL